MPAAPQRARRIAVCRFIGSLVLVDRARLPQQEQEESSAEQRGDDARAEFVREDEVAAEPVGDEHQRRAVEGGDGQLFFRADRAAAPRQVRGHQADKAERPDGQGGDGAHQRDEDEQQAAATAHGKAEAARDGFAERQQLQRFAAEQGAVSSSLSVRRAHKTTLAPCSANSSEIACPMPDDAPMTAAVLSFKSNRFDIIFP